MSTLRAAVLALAIGLLDLTSSDAHAQTQVWVNCESHGFNAEICDLGDPILSVNSVHQLSKASCNGNYGVGGNVLVVQNGCRANFNLTFSTSRAIHEVTCHSNKHRRQVCIVPAGTVHALWAANKVSDAPCRTGLDFRMIGPNLLEVTNGCRATFQYTVE